MNVIAKTIEPQKPLLVGMAEKYGLKPDEFSATVRKICGLPNASAEEFAAFCMVAKEYDLNPLLKEIYAFPAKGGGIVPIVSIDGWVNLVNSHPACDGFEFEFEHTDAGELISCTCRMYRKDRGRPVTVTEYLSECVRSSEPWKMKHRMLRHKAMIQASRYAFGFSGIYDEDEGAKIADLKDVTPATRPMPPRPPAPPSEIDDAKTIDLTDDGQSDSAIDYGDFFERLDAGMSEATDETAVEECWTEFDPEATLQGDVDSMELAFSIKHRRLAALSTMNGG